jgi:hypothetical protein
MGNWVSVAEAAASWERVREHVPFSSVLFPIASPVHYAAACGHNEVLEYLFAHTAPGTLPSSFFFYLFSYCIFLFIIVFFIHYFCNLFGQLTEKRSQRPWWTCC